MVRRDANINPRERNVARTGRLEKGFIDGPMDGYSQPIKKNLNEQWLRTHNIPIYANLLSPSKIKKNFQQLLIIVVMPYRGSRWSSLTFTSSVRSTVK